MTPHRSPSLAVAILDGTEGLDANLWVACFADGLPDADLVRARLREYYRRRALSLGLGGHRL